MKNGIHGKWNQEHMEQVAQFHKDYKPTQTNVDRIRAMTDEELAEFLEHVETEAYHDHSVSGRMQMIDWLQSEVEG